MTTDTEQLTSRLPNCSFVPKLINAYESIMKLGVCSSDRYFNYAALVCQRCVLTVCCVCRVPADMSAQAPTFTQPLQSVVALEGSAATFEAQVSGKREGNVHGRYPLTTASITNDVLSRRFSSS